VGAARLLLLLPDMIIALTCPHCNQYQNVVKFGKTRYGTQRYRCNDCRRTFAAQPKSRCLSQDKEQTIERALHERISQRGIARTLKVSPNTVRMVRKTGRSLL
jgi:transposase-like protein